MIKFRENIPEDFKLKINQLIERFNIEHVSDMFGGYNHSIQEVLFDEGERISSQDFINFYRFLEKWQTIKIMTHKLTMHNPSLLTHISSITLPNLSYLRLIKVRIATVEAFQWLNSPQLSQIQIMNQIHFCLKPFAKTKFDGLTKFQIFSNVQNNNQTSHLTRMKSKKKFDNFSLQYQYYDQQNNIDKILSSLSHKSKMQALEIQSIRHQQGQIEDIYLRSSSK